MQGCQCQKEEATAAGLECQCPITSFLGVKRQLKVPASLSQFPGSWITALALYNFNSCNSNLSVTHFPDYISFIEFQGLLIETQSVVFPFFFISN